MTIYPICLQSLPKSIECPLFSEDDDDGPGNRCRLSYRHALLLGLMRKCRNLIQEQLAVFFGMNQSTVCRYLKFSDTIFAEILPTPDAISCRIRNVRTTEELKAIVPDLTVIIDGTHTDIQRPSDKEPRKKAYSGEKSFTRNTQVMRQQGRTDGIQAHRRPEARTTST